ncbi:FIG00554380: hypothetical protein [Cronobacter malonaticus 681]|nr:FIG00554380: hypothetical protein [Cronobacter malonaticus 681]
MQSFNKHVAIEAENVNAITVKNTDSDIYKDEIAWLYGSFHAVTANVDELHR